MGDPMTKWGCDRWAYNRPAQQISDQSQFWWSKTISVLSIVGLIPLLQRGQGGFEAGPGAHDTLDRQRENLPPPLFVNEGSSADLASPHVRPILVHVLLPRHSPLNLQLIPDFLPQVRKETVIT